MYYQVISQCGLAVGNLDACLDKAEQFATAQEIDVGILMARRIAPDMQPFIYQVQSACDYLKAGAAWLSGQTPPEHEDNERTITEVRERIRKTVAFVQSVNPTQYEDAASRQIGVAWAAGKRLNGEDYLLQMIVPNVFFHVCMAYAILRNSGVNVGKMDFLGPIRWIES
jgi:uncharacterized protein